MNKDKQVKSMPNDGIKVIGLNSRFNELKKVAVFTKELNENDYHY